MTTIPRDELIGKLNKLSSVILTLGFGITSENIYGKTCAGPSTDMMKVRRLLLWRFYIDGLVLPRPFIDEATQVDESTEQLKALLIALKYDGI